MSDDQMDDLKQFIDSKVSQSESRIRDDLGGRIDGVEGRLGSVEGRLGSVEGRLGSLEQKVDDGFAGIGEAMEEQNKHVDERLTNLEQQAA